MDIADQERWKIVAECVQGDQHALNFIGHLNHIINIWDDLVDRDKPVTDDRINSAFTAALIHIPRNPFYRAHQAELQPVLEMSIAAWQAANDLEREFDTFGQHESLARAHMLRFDGVNVFVMCARLIGGQEWAVECAKRLYSVFPTDTLADYTREFTQ